MAKETLGHENEVTLTDPVTGYRREPTPAADDEALRGELRAFSARRPRWGLPTLPALHPPSSHSTWTEQRGPTMITAPPPRSSTADGTTSDEARECLNFFTRLLGLVDYQLNSELYDGRQARRPESEIAAFDLEPVSTRRTFVPPRRRSARATKADAT